MPLSDLSRLVYSTDVGRICPACRQPLASCACQARKAAQQRPAGDGTLRVKRETQGRGGKIVTAVYGAVGDDAALAALGKQLKAACSSGGTVKDGVIEIQGDHVERVLAALAKLGHRAKRAGG